MKKSLALILALIMVLCMLPSVAFAALDTGHSIDVRFTVLYVSDEFYLGYNTGSSEKTTFVCQYSTPHSDTAYNNHTIAISDIKAAADRASVNSGYQIVGWTKETSANPQIFGLNLPGSTACNKGTTIYLVAKESNPKPGKPSDNDIYGIVGDNAVKVHCTNVEAGHEDKTYALIAGSFNIGDVTKDNASGKYFCNITVHAGKYVDKYNNTYGSHTLDQNEGTAVIKLEYNNGKWEKVTQTPVVFTVKCENQTPEKPNPPEPENTSKPFIELTGEKAVKVKCTTAGATHAEKSYGLKPDGYTIGEVKGDATNGYTCDITVNPDKYVEAYNTEIGVTHTLAPAGQTGTIRLSWNGTDKKWELANPSGVPVVFTVKCENQTPEKPNPPEPENTSEPFIELTGEKAVKVKCTTAGATHAEKSYGLKPDGYTIGEVKGDAESGYTCDITVNPGEYVKAYNTEIGVTHTLAPAGQTGTIKLSWNGTDKKWELANPGDVPVEFTVKCDTVEPNDPPKPNEDDILRIVGNGAVKVHCDANTEHEDKIYGLLEGSFDIGDVTKDEVSGEYFCHITVHAGKYVDEYNKTHDGHTLATAGQTGMITLKWQPDVGGDGTRTWVVVSDIPVEFTVKCEDVNTYTVTYKDGVGGTAFKDQVHTGLKLGDATPGFTGTPYRWNYTFTGWKPAVAPTVSGNAVYTAQWSYNGGGWTPSYPINPVPPVVVVPPKTGDMPFWYSIAQFLGLVK